MSKLITRRELDWQGQPWPHTFAGLGVRGFSVNRQKHPCIEDFYDRATRNHDKIDRWRARFPGAGWSIITGADSGIVALDIDRKRNEAGRVVIFGIETLHRAGIVFMPPVTSTARTPSGGYRLLFRHPGVHVKTGALIFRGKHVPGVEIKGDGPAGHCIVAGPGYIWQPHYPPTLALAPLPPWAIMADEEHHPAPSTPPVPVGQLSAYGEKVIRSARKEILEAPPGTRHDALLRVVFNVAGFCEANDMPPSFALAEMEHTALEQPRSKPRPSVRQILQTVRDAFNAGLRKPYPRRERRR
jgi:putative DNA primase/helicase